MLAEMGQTEAAEEEMRRIARRWGAAAGRGIGPDKGGLCGPPTPSAATPPHPIPTHPTQPNPHPAPPPPHPTPTPARAPGSADMRIALAALLWRRGQEAEAEDAWRYACDNITVGCRKYTDADWLARVRRWPPSMRGALGDFLALKRGSAAAAS
jgi:hypothetical protein